jgi:hypothetical protein
MNLRIQAVVETAICVDDLDAAEINVCHFW